MSKDAEAKANFFFTRLLVRVSQRNLLLLFERQKYKSLSSAFVFFVYLRTTISFQVFNNKFFGYTIITVYFLILLKQSAPLMLTFLTKSKAEVVFHEAGNFIPLS